MDENRNKPPDEQLNAWLDNELDATARAHVDAWLESHPEDAARVRLWATDRDALRSRFDPVLAEPVSEALRGTVLRPAASAWHWPQAAMAAGLLLAGALLGGAAVWQFKPGTATSGLARGSWTQRAAVAHAVYSPEVRHPVEVNVAEGNAEQQRAQELHLARWLTKRLDMPVKLFDLRAEGYALVGGRLLPDAAGPSAQLMYQNADGQRVTVYLRKPEPGTATAFSWQQQGELGMFYWAEEGYGCALVGKLPRERLLALAERVYKQVENDIPPPPAKPPT